MSVMRQPAENEGAADASTTLPSRLLHDLRTPLNQIIGYAEMLLEDAESAGRAEAETSLRRLLDSAQACLEVQVLELELQRRKMLLQKGDLSPFLISPTPALSPELTS